MLIEGLQEDGSACVQMDFMLIDLESAAHLPFRLESAICMIVPFLHMYSLGKLLRGALPKWTSFAGDFIRLHVKQLTCITQFLVP